MSVFYGEGGPKLPQSGTFSANPTTMTAGRTAMGLYDAEAIARLNTLGRRARENIAEAISVAGAEATVTGAGSVYRIHMKPEPPTDYRSAFLGAKEKVRLDLFVAGLYQEGIVPLHTGAGMLSTPMGAAEVDRLGEAGLASFRRL